MLRWNGARAHFTRSIICKDVGKAVQYQVHNKADITGRDDAGGVKRLAYYLLWNTLSQHIALLVVMP